MAGGASAFKRRGGKIVRRRKMTTIKEEIRSIRKQLVQRKPETKWALKLSTTAADYTFANYNSVLDGISQGIADYNNRIGDSITLKTYNLKMRIDTPTTFTFPVVYRVLVFQVKDNPDHTISNVSYPALLLHDASVVSTTYAPFAFFDWDNHKSFHVLYDKMYTAQPGTGNTAGLNCAKSIVINKTFHFKNGKGKIQYLAAGVTPVSGELFYLVISNTVNSSTVVTANRFTYYDS